MASAGGYSSGGAAGAFAAVLDDWRDLCLSSRTLSGRTMGRPVFYPDLWRADVLYVVERLCAPVCACSTAAADRLLRDFALHGYTSPPKAVYSGVAAFHWDGLVLGHPPNNG